MPASPPRSVDLPAQIATRRRAENFPVALRALPAALRADLEAVYAVARLVDDAGDEATGDRWALLDGLETDLRRVWAGDPPVHPVVRDLVPTVLAHGLPAQPFLDLVEANRLDQSCDRYPTYDDLLRYCSLSANPVGRIVLEVFEVSTPQREALSDHVCTALQILEHCQDVAEDRRRGRIYLPLEDLERFRVDECELDRPTASPQVRGLVEFETERAAALLDSGARLVGELTGWARVAVAGYVAGGRATVDALRRADHDVLAVTPRPRPADVVRHSLALMARRR